MSSYLQLLRAADDEERVRPGQQRVHAVDEVDDGGRHGGLSEGSRLRVSARCPSAAPRAPAGRPPARAARGADSSID